MKHLDVIVAPVNSNYRESSLSSIRDFLSITFTFLFVKENFLQCFYFFYTSLMWKKVKAYSGTLTFPKITFISFLLLLLLRIQRQQYCHQHFVLCLDLLLHLEQLVLLVPLVHKVLQIKLALILEAHL